MKRQILFFSVLIGLSGCLQTENSSSLDADNYSDIEGSPAFAAARGILSQNCGGSCHNFHTLTETELSTLGLIVPGDSTGSKIYYRIKDSDGSGGPKNMPPAGVLSNTDMGTLADWIDNLTL